MTALRARWEWLLDVIENPIVARELRSAFRRRRFMFLLTTLLALVGVALLGSLFHFSGPKTDPSVVGRQAFLLFFLLELLLVLLVFPSFSCTSIVEERLNRSIDLLVTTRLRADQIAFGKLVAAVVYGLTFLVATAPLVAITFLYGGVSVGQIVLAYTVMIVSCLVVSSYGLMVSSLSASTSRSVVRTFIILPAVVLLVLTPLFQYLVRPLLYGPLAKDASALALRQEVLGLDLVNSTLLWVAVLAWVAMWVSLFFLVAANKLKPPIADRSTPLRSWFLICWLTAMGLLFGWLIYNRPHEVRHTLSYLGSFYSLSLLALTMAAVAFGVSSAEDDVGSRGISLGRLPLAPGAGAGGLFVMLIALLSYGGVVFVFVVPLDSWQYDGLLRLRSPLSILFWGSAWSLAFLLLVTQAAVLLSRLVRHGTLARIWLVFGVLLLVAYPGLFFALDKLEAKGNLYKGYVLSPLTVGKSILQEAPARDRRLILFGYSGKEIKKLARKRPGRRMTRRERRQKLLDHGVAVHKPSTLLYLLGGLGLLIINLRFREDAPPIPFRKSVAGRPPHRPIHPDSESEGEPEDAAPARDPPPPDEPVAESDVEETTPREPPPPAGDLARDEPGELIAPVAETRATAPPAETPTPVSDPPPPATTGESNDPDGLVVRREDDL